MPRGAESRTTYFQGTTGLSTQFNYAGIQKHKATLGAGIIYHWVTDVSNKINYLITPNFVTQIPLTEVSAFGSDPVLRSKTRTNFYALFQDEWNFANDFYLTTGLRYDYYSDVLDGISPRVSLVWNVNNTDQEPLGIAERLLHVHRETQIKISAIWPLIQTWFSSDLDGRC